jgi:hypothetical protein
VRDVVEILISLTALTALSHCFRQNFRNQTVGHGLAVMGVFCVVLGGFLYNFGNSPKGQALQLALVALLSALVLIQVHKNSRENLNQGGPKVRLAVYASPILAAVLFMVNATMNPGLPLIESMGRLLGVLYLILIVTFCVVSRLTISQAAHAITLAVLSTLVLAPLGGDAWRACDQFKCGPFGAIYTGPFASENGLAIIVAVGILSLLGSWHSRSSWLVIVPFLLTIFATESRTSQLALAVALCIWGVLVFWKSSSAMGARSSLGVWLLVIGGLFVTGLVMVYTSSPSAFSNRGNIWLRGTRALGDNWIFGLGLDRWTYLQNIGYMPGLFPHSQYLLILFSGGILGIFLLFLLFAAPLRRSFAVENERRYIVAYVLFLCVLGLTEVFWNPIAIDGQTFLVIPLIVSALRGSTYVSVDERNRGRPLPLT